MSFTDEQIKAIVKEAKYSDPKAEEYMTQTLIKRRDKTGRYWYNKVNPLDKFKVDGNILRFDDMAVIGNLAEAERTKYKWKLEYLEEKIQALTDYIEIDSPQITFTAEIIEKMKDAVLKSKQPDNSRNRVFSIDIRTKRGSRSEMKSGWSKSVRPHIHLSPQGEIKLIGIEREG